MLVDTKCPGRNQETYQMATSRCAVTKDEMRWLGWFGEGTVMPWQR